MATREGRPLSRGTRRWKPFLGFWREMVARWWEPTHQQCSLNQAFPGRELIGGQKGKREVNTYLPEIQGEIAGKGDPTMSKHVTVIVCEAQHGGGAPPNRWLPFWVADANVDFRKTVRTPPKPRGSPTILLVSPGLLLLPLPWNQRKSFLEYASFWDPEVYG